MASYTTEEGSPPSLPLTTGTPTRSPQISNCWIAPARNVSPAANNTECPSCFNLQAILPIVVVLPTPFTPTNSNTVGLPTAFAKVAKLSSPFS